MSGSAQSLQPSYMRTSEIGFDENVFEDQEAREINDEVNQVEHNKNIIESEIRD